MDTVYTVNACSPKKYGMVSLYQHGLKKGFNTSSWAEKNLFNSWVDACVFKLSSVYLITAPFVQRLLHTERAD